MKIAIISLSRHGSVAAGRLLDFFSDASLFIPEKLAEFQKRGEVYSCSFADKVFELFKKYDAIIFFCATGITVRMIAPHLNDKKTDPAILVVDDATRFVISLLSGHKGGANRLAKEVAEVLDAQPVITTASDSLGKISVDMIGYEHGWTLTSHENVTMVSAAVVNDEDVALLLDGGISLSPFENNKNLIRVTSYEEVLSKRFGAAILVTDREVPFEVMKKGVLFRPKRLCIGLGCNRGTPIEEFEDAVFDLLGEEGFSLTGVSALGTIDIKQDETGIIEFAEKYSLPIKFFSKEELAGSEVSTSEMVMKHIGIGGVSEPSAILTASNGILLIPKRKSKNVTVAVAVKF